MDGYIVCQRKRNAPRLNVRICEEKCVSKHDCKEYLAYIKVPVKPLQPRPLSPEEATATA